MDLDLRLREAVEEQDPGDAFTARVMAAVDGAKVIDIRSRRRRRVILLGGLLVVGAAAAMLALRLSDSDGKQTGELAPPAIADQLDADREIAAVGTPPAGEQVAAVSTAAASAEGPRRFTVLVMPLVDQSGEPEGRPPAEAFQAALERELRRMPDLVVLDSSRASGAELASVNFRLIVSSLGAKTLLPAQDPRLDGEGSRAPGTGFWSVEARFEVANDFQPGMQAGFHYYVQLVIGADGVPVVTAGCNFGAALRRMVTETPCGRTEGIASALVDIMRHQAMDPRVYQQRMEARLRDPALNEDQRRQALNALIAAEAESALDAASIKAIADYLSGLAPSQRKKQWQQLGARKDPRLVQAMLDALRGDPDEDVRLEVLKSLKASHAAEQRVMAAIESTARDDSSPLVRVAARRALHGDAEWNSYVIGTLRDSSLADKERLAPLFYAAQTASAAAQVEALAIIVKDEEVAQLLIRVVREGSSDISRDASRREMSQRALSLLKGVDRPEVLDLLIELAQGVSSSTRNLGLMTEVMNGLMKHRDDPRARKAIEEALDRNPMLPRSFGQQLTPPPDLR
jgi:hypothetical protein